MAQRKRPWRPTLGLSVRLVLVLMILLAAGAVTAISYFAGREAGLAHSRDMIRENAKMVRLRIVSYLEPAREAVKLIALLAEHRLIPVDEFGVFERYALDFLEIHDKITALNFARTDGELVSVRRLPDGSFTTMIVIGHRGARRVIRRYRETSDGASREEEKEVIRGKKEEFLSTDWYQGAMESDAVFWSDVRVLPTGGGPGVTASLAYSGKRGRPLGVLSADIELVELSHFLARRIRVGTLGQAFLLDGREKIVASRQPESLTTVEEGDAGVPVERLRFLRESTRPEVAALADAPEFRSVFAATFVGSEGGAPEAQRSGSLERIVPFLDGPRETVRYRVGGVDYVVALLPVEIGGRRWVAGVLAAEREFLEENRRVNFLALVTAGGATIVAILLGGLIANIISRALKLLVTETSKLERLEFGEDAKPVSAPFGEVNRVLDTIDSVKTGLAAFGKYVPLVLVRTLLEERVEPTLGGEIRDITLFFSDVRGFTTTSENMKPKDLAGKLGRYLSAVTDRIHEHHGTVDKYVGDAVMAFWNAPAEVEDHPVEACRAALRCLDDIAAVEAELGDIDFYTRIGIHTAKVTVGNFGSTDRLNYTAIGDGVNLASRLEGLNKVFGTQILVSSRTWRQVRSVFETRKVAVVSVKGREGETTIYELIGEKGEVDPDTIAWARGYEEALSLFLSRKFRRAEPRFAEVRLIAPPDDESANVILRACRRYMRTPPPRDWHGVLEMREK